MVAVAARAGGAPREVPMRMHLVLVVAAVAAGGCSDENPIATEAAERAAVDRALQSAIDQEAAARKAGDTEATGAAKAYTDGVVAGEADARAAAITAGVAEA